MTDKLRTFPNPGIEEPRSFIFSTASRVLFVFVDAHIRYIKQKIIKNHFRTTDQLFLDADFLPDSFPDGILIVDPERRFFELTITAELLAGGGVRTVPLDSFTLACDFTLPRLVLILF